MRVLRPERGIALLGTGVYLPERVVNNAELRAEGCPLEEAEIEALCGVLTRRRAAPHEATSDLALAAGRAALQDAGADPADVDRLVLATVSGDHPSPATACLVQHALGLRRVPAYDLAATCSGFLFGLDAAARALLTGEERVLVIAAEIRSRFVDPTDRATSALFGDGAGAALLGTGPTGRGLVALATATDGIGARSVWVPAGGSREPASQATVAAGRHRLQMDDGPQVYFEALEAMLAMAEAVLDAAGVRWSEVRRVVPHQANTRLVRRLAKLAGVPLDRVQLDVPHTGNLSSASVPVALHHARTGPGWFAGEPVLLVAAGAGHTAGAAVIIP